MKGPAQQRRAAATDGIEKDDILARRPSLASSLDEIVIRERKNARRMSMLRLIEEHLEMDVDVGRRLHEERPSARRIQAIQAARGVVDHGAHVDVARCDELEVGSAR